MMIKGRLAQKIVQRTGLGHHPGHIRDKIRHANIDDHTRHKILHEYDKLILGKPMEKHEVEKLLDTLGNKKIVNITGTYIHTIAHNPEKVIHWAKNTVKTEDHERVQEQMHVEEEQLKKIELEKKMKKEEKEEANVLVSAPVNTHSGKTAVPAHFKKAA